MDRPRVRRVAAGSVTSSGAGTMTLRYEEDPVVAREEVAATPEEAWRALLRAFEEEGLVPDEIDPEARFLAVRRFEWSGERNEVPLSLFVDCGLTTTGRPLADGADVVGGVMGLVVEGGGGGSWVSIRMDAHALPRDGSSERVVGCTTTGRLENALLERVTRWTRPSSVAEGERKEPTGRFSLSPGPPPAGGPAVGERMSGMTEVVSPGDRIRVRLSPVQRLTGSFLGIRGDTLLLRRSRVTKVPVSIVETLEVERTSPGYTLLGGALGAAGGVTLAMTTDLGIGGRHQIQGKVLNPGLGAITGGLAGAFLAHVLLATRWEDVSMVVAGGGTGSPGISLGFSRPSGPGR